jgi:hypothetical protein
MRLHAKSESQHFARAPYACKKAFVPAAISEVPAAGKGLEEGRATGKAAQNAGNTPGGHGRRPWANCEARASSNLTPRWIRQGPRTAVLRVASGGGTLRVPLLFLIEGVWDGALAAQREPLARPKRCAANDGAVVSDGSASALNVEQSWRCRSFAASATGGLVWFR